MRKLLLAAVAVTILFAGCAGGKTANVIKIGWFGPVSGDSALWGTAERDSLVLLFEQYNAKGGLEVKGKKYQLELVPYDDKGDAIEAVNVAQRLTSQDKVVAVIGPQGSGEAIPVSKTMNDAKVPLVATTATNVNVTVDPNGTVHPYMFRACFIDSYQGKVAARFAFEKLGLRKAAMLIAVDDAYSVGLGQFFKETFEQLGGKVVEEVTFTSGEKEFRAPLTKIKAAQPDVIFMPYYYTDVATSARQARELGINTMMIGGDGWPSESLIELAGTALEGCYFINHLDFDGELAKPFRDAYKAKYNKNAELNSYMAHDAALVVFDAIQRAEKIDGPSIQAALLTTDLNGVTGRIRMGPQHDPIGKDAWITQILGKKMVFKEKFQAE